MSINITLVLSSSEESYSFKLNSADELLKYITTILKINHFNLITEKGEKINKKNWNKLNDYFTSFTYALSFLIIPSSTHIKADYKGSIEKDVKDSIANQKKIKAILNSYFKNTIEKINNKLQLLNRQQIKYAKHKEFLESNFNEVFGRFKTFFNYNEKDKDIIQNDFDIIEQAVNDYNKISLLYQDQLRKINESAKELIEDYERNINRSILREDKEEMTLNERVKVRVFNTHMLQNIIEKESDSKKKELLNKIAEISLYKKNLEQAMSITNIPQMFITDAKEILNEVMQRKNFDYCFGKIMNFIQNVILVKEEERRKTFCVWLNLQSKNKLYTKFINTIYENNPLNNNNNNSQNNPIEVNGQLNGAIKQLDDHLNNIIQVLYQPLQNNNNYDANLKESINVPLSKSYYGNNNTEATLQTISFELSKIMKETFKITYQEDISSSPQDKIFSMIKTISEKLHNSNPNNQLLDISNASLAYSIMLDDKQQSYMNPNYMSAEMEKFVLKHEDRLYFYESLYEFIEIFAKNNKLNLKAKINKDNPQSLGNAIELILKEYLDIKKKYNKCIILLKQLKTQS